MIIVAGQIEIDPDHAEAFREEVDRLVPATQAETGCHTYDFWAHRSNPGVFHVFEEWADDEALTAHLATDHYRSFGRAMRNFGVKRADVLRYDAPAGGASLR